jgi:hypothetical protein
MVTLAIIRTVVFETPPVPSPLCEVPHAVTHRSGAGAACRAEVPESSSSAKPATNAILDRTEALLMRGVYRQIARKSSNAQLPIPKSCWT